MKLLKIVSFAAIAAMMSCRSTKKVAYTTPPLKDTTIVSDTTAGADSVTIAKAIWAKWQSDSLHYRTISGKLGVSIDIPNLINQSFAANLRSAKDSLIWISLTGPLGFEGARAKITIDSAIVINKLNNTVEKRSISYIQNLIHQPLNFRDIQSILTGRTLLSNAPIQSYRYNADHTWNFIFVQNNIQNSIVVDPASNRVLQNQLTDLSVPTRTCTIQYKNFQNMPAGWIPWYICITIATQNEAPVKVELSYKQVSFDQNLDYPFNIPAKSSILQ